MKFKTLAIAIAAATVSTAAMADGHMGAPEFKISGDVTVGYFAGATDDNERRDAFGGNGSEVIFDASQKVGGITYFGSMTANVSDSVGGGDIVSDDMYVGFRGAFGEVRMGDTDNGCDIVDTGWVVDDEFISHNSGGCKASDQNNLTYRGSRGPVRYAIGYSPDVTAGSSVSYVDEDPTDGTDKNENVISVGVAGKVGPATLSFGYESESRHRTTSIRLDDNGEDEKFVDAMPGGENIILGVSGNFGPVSVGVRMNKFENEDHNGEDTYVGYSAQYSAGPNKFYAAYGDIGDDADTIFLGYQRAIGSNTTFITEYVNVDGPSKDLYAVALKHSF